MVHAPFNDGTIQMRPEAEEVIARLGEMFVKDDIPYARMFSLIDIEDAHGTHVAGRFLGFYSLGDGFKCFFFDTIDRLNELAPRAPRALPSDYPLFVARLVLAMRLLRSTEVAAMRGYPLQGYASLRNAMESLVLISGALQGVSDFHGIEGVKEGEERDFDLIYTERMKTEKMIFDWAWGDTSRLSEQVKREIISWRRSFNFETHGSRFSLAATKGWLEGREPLSVVPRFDGKDFSIYMNSYVQVAWMAHRLLPFLQPPELPLSEEWRGRWGEIDGYFRHFVESTSVDLGRKIGEAFSEFVTSKFPFQATNTFPRK